MPCDCIVIDSSAIITLFRSGQAQLLPRLLSHIANPQTTQMFKSKINELSHFFFSPTV